MRLRLLVTLAVGVLAMTESNTMADPMKEALTPPLPKGVKVTSDVVYRAVDGHKLLMDIYTPDSVGQGTAPAVMYVHGGGFSGGDRSSGFGFRRDTYPLMAAGFIVASIDYRLAPQYKFPAMVEDSKAAVRFLRANAARYHIDPDRIGTMGESAGGYIVAMLGLAQTSAGFDVGDNLDQSSAVKAVVDLYGLHDLTLVQSQDMVRQAFGPPEVITKASPVTYVRSDAPPFLVIHGDKDGMVAVAQSDVLVQRMKEAKARVKYIRVKNANHGFWEAGGPIDPPMSEITSEIVGFFQKELK